MPSEILPVAVQECQKEFSVNFITNKFLGSKIDISHYFKKNTSVRAMNGLEA